MKVKKIFNNLADTYKNSWTFSEIEYLRINSIVEQFGIKQGMSIIEAGCGKGDFSPFILEKIGNDGFLWLVDISEKMLNYARNKLLEFSNVAFLNENVENINLSSQSIDMIICFNSFPHFINKHNVLIEFNRLLKENGILIIAHSSEREKINKLHLNYGFDIKTHYLPSKYILAQMLHNTGFYIEKYNNNSYYLLKAIKIGNYK